MRLSAEELIQPISAENPCGEDLEYDPAFQQMEGFLQSKTEQEFGDTVIPGSGPDWKGVGDQAADLLKRTRDLRVVTYAAVSQLHTKGLAAFWEGLKALNGCMETFWDQIYPELDVEDNNDATMRYNSLQVLNDHRMVCEGLTRSPLVILKGIGGFSLRDIELAEGKISPVDDEQVHDLALIQGAFSEASSEDMTALGESLHGTVEELKRTVALWAKLAVDGSVIDFDETLKVLNNIRHVISTYAPVAAAVAGGDVVAAPAAAAAPVAESGSISSRQDVIRALDRICDYYSANEPSSPVPLLLRRAQRLVPKTFYEILEDMIPDSMSQAKVIGGKTDS